MSALFVGRDHRHGSVSMDAEAVCPDCVELRRVDIDNADSRTSPVRLGKEPAGGPVHPPHLVVLIDRDIGRPRVGRSVRHREREHNARGRIGSSVQLAQGRADVLILSTRIVAFCTRRDRRLAGRPGSVERGGI